MHAEVGDHVGLGAGVGLDVDVLGAGEEGQGPLLGEPLGDVHVLAAAVVALAGQALGVLVGEPAALGLHHGGPDVVLAGDQLDLVALAAALPSHRLPELGIDLGDACPITSGRCPPGSPPPPPSVRAGVRGSRRVRTLRGPLSSHDRRPRPGRASRRGGTYPRLGLDEGAADRGQDLPDPLDDDGAGAQDPRRRPSQIHDRRGPARPPTGPPSRIRSTASPSGATTSAADRASGSPDRFAEVVGSGPTAAASARGAGWSGTRRPIVGAPPVRTGGSVTPAAGGRSASGRPARTPRRGREPPASITPIVGRPARRRRGAARSRVGRAAALAAKSRSMPPRRAEAHGDPVDRVGGERHDPAGLAATSRDRPSARPASGASASEPGDRPGRCRRAAALRGRRRSPARAIGQPWRSAANRARSGGHSPRARTSASMIAAAPSSRTDGAT